MALEPNELARRDADRTEYRAEPMRVRIELSDLITADHNDLRIGFECSMRPAEQSADRKMLHEIFLAQKVSATCDDVTAYFSPVLRSVAEATARTWPAADLLSESGQAALLAALRKAIDDAAFAAGLIVFAPFSIKLNSPSLLRQQIESMERARAEASAAGRVEHLRHAGELLKQFESIRSESPQISAGQVLESVVPADRGAMLESLLAATGSASTTQTLYAVAGPFLVSMDPNQRPAKPEVTPLPPTLGPMRSIQPAQIDGQSVLLIGAQRGVFCLDPKNPSAATAYEVPDLISPLGFNRAIVHADRYIVSTHSDAGMVVWEVGKPDRPIGGIRAEGGDGFRHLEAVDSEWIAVGSGNRVRVINRNGVDGQSIPPASSAKIVSIIAEATRLFIVHEDGTVCTLDRQTRQITRHDSRGGPFCAAASLPWLDGIRLLLACDAGPIDCIGTDDSVVTRYNSNYRGLRDLAASPAAIAGVSPDRQRLLIWDSSIGRAPAVDLHLTALARHRIADITFA